MQDVTLSWRGQEFTVNARDVLPLIARIEHHVTLAELYNDSTRQTIQLSRLAQAFGAALRFAGAAVTDNEVYEGLFDPRDQLAAVNAVNALLSVMIPPEHLTEKAGGKKKARAGETPGDNLSKRPTRRASRGD